jgi:signal recognition particle subunit SRP54
MGGLGGVMGMLPGAQAAKKAMESGAVSDKSVKRQIAVIQSMTKQERAKPDLLNASRRKRIAAGAGVDVSEVNKVIKMHRSMSDMVKAMGKGGMKGLMGKMGGMFGGKMPPMDPAAMQRLGQQAASSGGGLPGLPGQSPPQGLPGLGNTQTPGGFTGLPGLPFGKK